MSLLFSRLLAWGSVALLVVTPLIVLYFLIDIERFAALVQTSMSQPIDWASVTRQQWYGVWLLTVLNAAFVWASLYFLASAFFNFSRGEHFNRQNSRHFRTFSIIMFLQVIYNPVHYALCSVLLSLNHPTGQKVLSISFGSGEVKVLALAMILWVISDLLLKASELDTENKRFV